MLFTFESDFVYRFIVNNLEKESVAITVSSLTIRQIIVNPLLKNVSVLFFEAPASLVIFNKDEYSICLNENLIATRIQEMIDNDLDGLLNTIFEINNDKLKEDNSLMISEVIKLKRRQAEKKKVLDGAIDPVDPVDIAEVELDNFNASNEIQNQRFAICSQCEFFESNALKGTGMCNACKCPLPYKIKKISSSCPKDKWVT